MKPNPDLEHYASGYRAGYEAGFRDGTLAGYARARTLCITTIDDINRVGSGRLTGEKVRQAIYASLGAAL